VQGSNNLPVRLTLLRLTLVRLASARFPSRAEYEPRTPEDGITVRYRVLYPSVTLWPLPRTERRAIIERINPSIPNFGTYSAQPAVVGRCLQVPDNTGPRQAYPGRPG
jgi:hypothetical protein